MFKIAAAWQGIGLGLTCQEAEHFDEKLQVDILAFRSLPVGVPDMVFIEVDTKEANHRQPFDRACSKFIAELHGGCSTRMR